MIHKNLILIFLMLATVSSQSFCGFYVAQAGASLFNHKSEIILVRDGNYSTITMSNDFKGSVQDFAMVIPIPNVLQRQDIKIVERSLFQLLDNYSAPRLVEYFDPNPCMEYRIMDKAAASNMDMVETLSEDHLSREEEDHGVKIEARYEVDEYDILILSAEQSEGLKTWLLKHGYDIPDKAEEVLDPYIKNGLKFFVVKVNLRKYRQFGENEFLRPIQIKVKTDRFMLPIRLGMANSNGEQDMLVYAFSKTGRVETTNYKTEKIPSNIKIPTFIKDQFGRFYSSLFDRSYEKSGKASVFLEYAWTVTPNWGGVKCDPCTGNPPYFADLASAGVDWISGNEPVFFTRLHVRYSRDWFPEDLFFQNTPNTEHFQGRYILTHAASGQTQCSEASDYWSEVRNRRRNELLNMAGLTGWDPLQNSDYIYTGNTAYETKMKEGSLQFTGFRNDGKGFRLFLILNLIFLLYYTGRRVFKIFSLSNI